MPFRKKPKDSGIFDDLPVFESHESTQQQDFKKHGRRAMLVPEFPATADANSAEIFTNTGKQKEDWLEIIFLGQHREDKPKVIAAWLEKEYRVQKWWAHSLALSYIQWRESSKSNSVDDSILRIQKVIDASPMRIYNLLNSTSLYGETFARYLKQVDGVKLSMSFTDETRASITLVADKAGCNILIEHEFIDNLVMRKIRTKFWKQILDQVSTSVIR